MGNNVQSTDEMRRQAVAFGKYFVRAAPDEASVDLYIKFLSQDATPLSQQDQKLIDFITSHPWSIGPVDGALVFISPHSEVRRRLYIMFAVLESSPVYWDYFLPRQRSPLYLLWVGLVGIRAVLKTLVGIIVVKVLI